MNNLENIIFFNQIEKDNYSKAIKCLNGQIINYSKDEYLNIKTNSLKAAIILEGIVDLVSIDIEGRLTLHNRYFKNQSFIFNIKNENKGYLSITSSKVLILDLESIFNENKKNCPIRATVMENIIKLQNSQSHELNYKTDIYLEKSLRKKIIKYLKKLEPMYNDKKINIPFNREDLASYLSCDRSALSRELSRMEKDGLIKVNKNIVTLINI